MDNTSLNALYSELGKFSGAINQLLQSIDKKIDDLPDNRDFNSIMDKIKKVLIIVDDVKDSISKHCSDFEKNKEILIDMKNVLIDSKKIFNDIQLVLCDKNSELLSQIKTINQLAILITDEINKSNILLGEHGQLKLHDFGEIITFAKRSNKRYEMWGSWKGKIAIVIGTIVASGFLIDRFRYLVELIIEFMKTY